MINHLAPNAGGVNPWTNTTLLTQVQQALAGGYAQNLIINGLRGSVVFQQNPNIFITELLQIAARFNYNALQAEVRRRFKNGLSFQANYTFQKTLTDLPFEDQNRQGETQESNNPELNYGRSDFDRTHVFNANMIFELPFGKGKQYLNSGGWMNALVGGWQFTSIVNLESGARSESSIRVEQSRSRSSRDANRHLRLSPVRR